MAHTGERARLVELFLGRLQEVDRMVLVELAERGRGQDVPPAFRGRCLDAGYLHAVAQGTWSLDDEALLARAEERLEGVALSRVRRLDRRGLRTVLRGVLLALVTTGVAGPSWDEYLSALRTPWDELVGAPALSAG